MIPKFFAKANSSQSLLAILFQKNFIAFTSLTDHTTGKICNTNSYKLHYLNYLPNIGS